MNIRIQKNFEKSQKCLKHPAISMYRLHRINRSVFNPAGVFLGYTVMRNTTGMAFQPRGGFRTVV